MNRHRILIGLLLAVLLGLGIWMAEDNRTLGITEITASSQRLPEPFRGFRIAQISDLHNTEFGDENSDLLSMLSGCKPDIIVITGDLVDSRRTDIPVALAFAEQAVRIAPVYYVSGNHEARIAEYAAMKSSLQELGVMVLEDASVTIWRDNASITLIGIQEADRNDPKRPSMSELLDRLQEGTEGYRVLLCHRPEFFQTYVDAGIDLVFAGHAHGGQFRLPGLGGLLAPDQGFFPKYDSGAFTENRTTMVVSRGLGNSRFPLRINNPPEIVLVNLKPQERDT